MYELYQVIHRFCWKGILLSNCVICFWIVLWTGCSINFCKYLSLICLWTVLCSSSELWLLVRPPPQQRGPADSGRDRHADICRYLPIFHKISLFFIFLPSNSKVSYHICSIEPLLSPQNWYDNFITLWICYFPENVAENFERIQNHFSLFKWVTAVWSRVSFLSIQHLIQFTIGFKILL